MRLMTSEPGEELPLEKYVRFKNDSSLWKKEMEYFGLTAEEQEVIKPYFETSYGVPPMQEQLMMMLMDENICNFSIGEANSARKIVGKKLMSKIPELHEQILSRAKSPKLGEYVWKFGAGPQLGYAFSLLHSTAYSLIGYQVAYMATKYNPIFWNTACLIVNSNSLVTAELRPKSPFTRLPKMKNSSNNYEEVAKALGEIINQNIKVSLIDINKSDYTFTPDIDNNRIRFGLKALSGVNNEVIKQIFKFRPYNSIKEFMTKVTLKKPAMISLIKSGAFDELKIERELSEKLKTDPRMIAMVYYLSTTSKPKKRLTLQNFNGLCEKNMIPESLNVQKVIYDFNKFLKKTCKTTVPAEDGVGTEIGYVLKTPKMQILYATLFDEDELEIDEHPFLRDKVWKKQYQEAMDKTREWLKENQEQTLREYNYLLFKEEWNKYAKGSISAWEMESLCFYYHDHELKNVDNTKYGLSDFAQLSRIPEVSYTFHRNGRDIPLYKLTRIAGTVISKNDNKSSITLMTTTGVCSVKFTRDYYAMFSRQLSATREDGSRKVMEKGWFKRGTKIIVTGFRRDDTFVCKKYKNVRGHRLYKIEEVLDDGELLITTERWSDKNEEE